MKKIILSLFILSGINTIGLSQATIPNQNLENWEQIVIMDSIKHWDSSTQQYQNSGLDITNSYLVDDAQHGDKAVHLETVVETVNNETDTLMGYVVQQNAEEGYVGFPYSEMVTNLKGWYKCNNIANDTAVALVALKNNGVVFSETMHMFISSATTWTQFDIQLTGGNTMTPDSIFVGFASSNFENEDNQEPGNWLEIDNIWFENNSVATTPISGFSFEELIQETIEQPVGFWSFDQLLNNPGNELSITKSSDAAEGLSSMKIEKTQSNEDEGLFAIATNGNFSFQNDFNGGTAFNAQPSIFSVQYKYTPVSLDTAYALVNILKNGITLNTDTIIQLLPEDNWTTKVLAININQAPDSVRVTFYSGENVGSALYIDDIQFLGGDVSVDEISAHNEWTMYPNPANSELNIAISENTFIEVVDLNGKIIYSEFTSANLATVSTEKWNTGIYFVTVRHNNKIETKKLVITH